MNLKTTPRYRSVLHMHQNKSLRISCQYPEVSRYVNTRNIHRVEFCMLLHDNKQQDSVLFPIFQNCLQTYSSNNLRNSTLSFSLSIGYKLM